MNGLTVLRGKNALGPAWLLVPLITLLVGACSHAPAPSEKPAPVEAPPAKQIKSSSDLIGAMHDRYADSWYRTLRFSQTNTFYTQSGGEQKSRWVEHLIVPGRLRIDFEPLSSKSGLLIVNNRVTTFDNGKRVDARHSIQAILTLTADVYAIPARITQRRLDSLGIDMAKFREDRFEKKRAYVMGGGKDDLESNQAWIDADKLVLLRLIQREKRGDRTIVTDTHVGQYKDIDGFVVAHEFVSMRDG
ncbi:MAG: hypothetical protein ABIZ36_01450, partial [Gemmatimonadaceae bacterium]